MIVVGIWWNAKSLEVYQENEEEVIIGTNEY
jgi:hypothetical protein